MWVHGDSDCFLVHLTTLFRMVTKFHNSAIVSLASPRGILELPSAVFSICQNLNQKLFRWHIYDRCTNCKFINWYPDMTIGMLVQCTVFLIENNLNYYSYRWAFLESTEISASE